MVLVGQWGAEEGHDAVPGELIYGAFVAVDFVHEYLEAAFHDLVDFLRVQLLGDRGVAGNVGKEDRHQLALAFQGFAGAEYLLRQELGRVRLGFGVVDGSGWLGFS